MVGLESAAKAPRSLAIKPATTTLLRGLLLAAIFATIYTFIVVQSIWLINFINVLKGFITNKINESVTRNN